MSDERFMPEPLYATELKLGKPMTDIKARLEKWKQEAELAHREICKLADGSRRWEMCVPVQDTDSDVVLQKPIDALNACLPLLLEAASFVKNVAEYEIDYTGQRTTWEERTQEDARKLMARLKGGGV
jgi:hypothetical protein